MSDEKNEEKIITGKVAAKILRVSYTHIYTLIEEGKLHRVDPFNPLKKIQPLRFKEREVMELAYSMGLLPRENPSRAETPAA